MVPIGRLALDGPGREVYGAEGTTTITGVEAVGRAPVYRVRLRSGNAVEATGGHLVYVTDRHGRGGHLPVSALSAGHHLALHARRPSESGSPVPESEAALSGWLLSDGHVRDRVRGRSRTITVVYITINDSERQWLRHHSAEVFPGVRYTEERTATEGPTDLVSLVAHGERFRWFVERYGLLGRGVDARVPDALFDADLDAVRSFLRSAFESDGHVGTRSGVPTHIEYKRISLEFVAGVQRLLLRLGVFARVYHQRLAPPRKDSYRLSIASHSELAAFEREVGFVSPRKRGLLEVAVDRKGRRTPDVVHDSVVSVEPVGVEKVYRLVTESGDYLSGNVRVHDGSPAEVSPVVLGSKDRPKAKRPAAGRPPARSRPSTPNAGVAPT